MIGYTISSIGTAFMKMQRNPARAIGTVLILSVLFFVIFVMLMFTSFTAQTVNTAGEKVQITLFLNNDINDTSLALLKAKMLKMEKDGEIADFTYTSSKDTLQQFAQTNPDTYDFIKQNLQNDMPSASSFTITPGSKSIESLLQYFLTGEFKSYIDTNRLAKSSSMIIQGKRLLEFLQFLEYGIFGVIGVVVLATIVVIAWFLASSFAIRKKEIFIMRLVGGSAWFIRIPFLVEALVLSFIGVVLGWSLFFVLRFEALQRLVMIFSTRTEAIAVAKTINAMWATFLNYLPYLSGIIFLFLFIASFMVMEYLLRTKDILK